MIAFPDVAGDDLSLEPAHGHVGPTDRVDRRLKALER
jgi:hypothetical protein